MSNYFSQIPNFEYVSRLPDAKISDYITVKNLFKRGILREDIFQNLAFFTKYQIKGNDRPDNVAFEFYNDSNLDWLVLVCNNIINIQTEWPLTQTDFEGYLIEKYGDSETVYGGIHHYETNEVKNTSGAVIVPAGLQVESNYTCSYYDSRLKQLINTSPVRAVTNYEYESELENDKRNIFLLKSKYINVVRDDIEDMMTYKKGSTQYKSRTLKTADNIRLFE